METLTEALDAWDETLGDAYGDTVIAGYTFDTARALRELDPIAYRCGFYDWIDSQGIDSDTLTGDDSRLA